jgi:manganese transport protein
VVVNPDMLYAAIGILGATVMPHNLYLHSSIVQTRAYPRTPAGKAVAIKYGTIDSSISLSLSFFINAAILILAGASFHYGVVKRTDVADINDAYHLLTDALGTKVASILFGVALLASGQNATITATLVGGCRRTGSGLACARWGWRRRHALTILRVLPHPPAWPPCLATCCPLPAARCLPLAPRPAPLTPPLPPLPCRRARS